MNISKKLPLIHLTENNAQVRVPYSMRGKSFSVISLGACNMSCPYCFLGGNLPRKGMTFPNTKAVSLKVIYEFIDEQVAKGNPLKISGGEPTIMQAAALQIAKYIKSRGGYLCLDTSGWNPNLSLSYVGLVDQVAIDLKGPQRYVCRLTNLDLVESYHNPIKTIAKFSDKVETLEVRTMIFNFTTINDLVELADFIPPNAYWNLRKFVTDWTPFDAFSKSDHGMIGKQGPALISYPSWLLEGEGQDMAQLIQELLEIRPELKKRIVGLFGSPRFSNGKQGENCGNSSGTIV